MPDDHVEAIAMEDEVALPVRGRMERPFDNFNTVKIDAVVAAKDLVMIARDVDDSPTGPRFTDQVLNNGVVSRRPVGSKRSPVVEYIPHQVYDICFMAPQEIEKTVRTAPLRAKMCVGEKQA